MKWLFLLPEILLGTNCHLLISIYATRRGDCAEIDTNKSSMVVIENIQYVNQVGTIGEIKHWFLPEMDSATMHSQLKIKSAPLGRPYKRIIEFTLRQACMRLLKLLDPSKYLESD